LRQHPIEKKKKKFYKLGLTAEQVPALVVIKEAFLSLIITSIPAEVTCKFFLLFLSQKEAVKSQNLTLAPPSQYF
jgi:hypothetical protein